MCRFSISAFAMRRRIPENTVIGESRICCVYDARRIPHGHWRAHLLQELSPRMPELTLTASLPLITGARELIPSANFLDTLAFATDVVLPTIAKGVIVRRPRVM